MAIIEARRLVKTYRTALKRPGFGGAVRALLSPEYRTVTAVDGLSLAIERGEIVGYLGPNGAGKSTTIKMLSGILEPTSGEVRVDGLDPRRDRKKVASRLGVVFGQRSQLEWDLRLGESFELLRRIYRVPEADHRRVLARLDEVLRVGELADKPVRTLSLGQRMRGELAAALLHEPPILFLDEPTIGLDIEARQRMREMVREINRARGTTILLTSHDLDDVEQLCTRLVVINHGRIVEDGPLDALVARLAPCRVLIVECERPLPAGTPAPVEGASIVRHEGARLWLEFDRSRTTAAELIARVTARWAVRDLSIEEPDIEEMLKRIYRDG